MSEKHNPVVFSRQESLTGPKDVKGEPESPQKRSTGRKVEVEDPRSPPPAEVPRTPGVGRKKLVQNDSTPAKRPTPVDVSPLSSIVFQSQADGTPRSPASPGNRFAPTSPLPTQHEEQHAPHSADVPEPQPNRGIFSALCCCLNSKAKQGGDSSATDSQQQLRPLNNGNNSSSAAGASTPSKEEAKTPVKRGGRKSKDGKPLYVQTQRIAYVDPAHPTDDPLLPPMLPVHKGRKCMVLDLDETLVHSSFREVPNPDYIIPVHIEGMVHKVYVCKRPGVDEFLRRCGKVFEIVVYTASLNKYADPLLDRLDVDGVITHRLFRESCTFYQGSYVKNLSLLGRDLSQTIIVDNSPLSYLFHPENAIDCTSWIDQEKDDELCVIEDFCELINDEPDVRLHLKHWRKGSSYKLK